MKAKIVARVELEQNALKSLLEPIRLESISSPSGGALSVDIEGGSLVIVMESVDLSTSRAMLNSYLGLLSTALAAYRV
ncbi:MAG: hypothetical protein U9R75_09210 [Candidatus Thermoplasmatota archaeon]|nr:hypothetical protein [Candidatus Thermoplasmatota archaeon]